MEDSRDGDMGEGPPRNLGAGEQIPKETVAGTVEFVICYDPENEWGVFNVRVPGEPELIKLVGTTTGIDPGVSIQAEGHWGEHSRYGRQFEASKITISRETLVGTVEDVICYDSENEWGVFTVRVPGESELVKLVGTTTGIDSGMSIQAEGGWVEHSKYGWQFQGRGISNSMPTSLDTSDQILRETLVGTVEHVICYDPGNEWGVFKMRVPGESEPVKLVGTTISIDLGVSIQAEGSWGEHSKYGRQFEASSITISMPTSLGAGDQISRETLVGTVEQVIFYDPENEWGVFSVRVLGESEPVKLVGTTIGIDPGASILGGSIQAEGSWVEHSKHGWQLQGSGITVAMPTGLDGRDS